VGGFFYGGDVLKHGHRSVGVRSCTLLFVHYAYGVTPSTALYPTRCNGFAVWFYEGCAKALSNCQMEACPIMLMYAFTAFGFMGDAKVLS